MSADEWRSIVEGWEEQLSVLPLASTQVFRDPRPYPATAPAYRAPLPWPPCWSVTAKSMPSATVFQPCGVAREGASWLRAQLG